MSENWVIALMWFSPAISLIALAVVAKAARGRLLSGALVAAVFGFFAYAPLLGLIWIGLRDRYRPTPEGQSR